MCMVYVLCMFVFLKIVKKKTYDSLICCKNERQTLIHLRIEHSRLNETVN